MMETLDRAMLWCGHRYLSAIEVLNILVLLWWWYVLSQLSPEQAASRVLYGRMDAVAPITWWAYASLIVAGVKVAGIVFQKPALLIIAAMFVAVWWATIGVMIIQATGLYLTPSVYFIVVAASLFRVFEITVQMARVRDG